MMQETSSSSTPPSRSAPRTRNASTRLSFNSAPISKPSSTAGAVRLLPLPHITPTNPSPDNANRAAQAQSKIKVLEKLPELEPPEEDDVVKFKFQEAEKISPPLLQLSEVSFGYTKDKPILKGVNIDVGLDSRLAIIGANGAGKSTLCVRFRLCCACGKFADAGEDRMKLLIGEISPTHGQQSRNGRLRIACASLLLPTSRSLTR